MKRKENKIMSKNMRKNDENKKPKTLLSEYDRKIKANLKSMRRRVANEEYSFKLVNNFNQTIKSMLIFSKIFNEISPIKNYYFNENNDKIRDLKHKSDEIKLILNIESEKKKENESYELSNEYKKILKEYSSELSRELNYIDRRYKKVTVLNQIDMLYKKNEAVLSVDSEENYKTRVIFAIAIFNLLNKKKVREYRRFYKAFKKHVYYNKDLKGVYRSFEAEKYCVNLNDNILENRIFKIDGNMLLTLFDHYEKHIRV